MKKLLCVLPAIALALTGLLFMACPDGNDDDPLLSGSITITPAGPVTVGTQLTANYTGNEQVSYQWKNGSTDVGTGSTCTPITAGSYTVTVGATGFTSKTSAAVTVTGGSIANTDELKAAIKNAYDAKYGVKEAADASEVAAGVLWVTTTEMKSLNDAIEDAETARDSAATQAAVDAARAQLEGTIAAFNAAKKQGTAAAITLSGTITIKDNGQTVPYVIIYAHNEGWGWQEGTRISSSEANSPWSITSKPFAVETEIFFRVQGYQNEFDGDPLFNIDVKNFSVSVKDTDKSNINIDLANLSLITLSGTLNVSYDGKPVPSVVMQVIRKSDYFLLGESPYLYGVGNNTPWSIGIEALTEETDVVLSIVGSNHVWDAWSETDRLFALWNQDFGVTVKDQNVSGIALNLITISGTISVTYNGNLVPYVFLDLNSFGEDGLGWLGNTMLTAPVANTRWLMVIPALDTAQNNIGFYVGGGQESNWDRDLFFREMELNLSIKDQNISGITLDLGEINSVSAEEPYISAQPQGGGYISGQTIAPLSVTAAVTDGGTLSYQWYEAASNGGVGTVISGATSATYQPVPSGTGDYYFYVVVTNTNDNVSGNKTAQITSNYAMITMYDQGIPNANATITVNTADRYQYIRGYGGMDVAWANFPETRISDYETMYAPDKLGYNILRVMIPPLYTNINIGIQDLIDRHRPYYYEGVKIVNKYGGYVLATPWSPPQEWKTNNSINGGGSLKYENYQDYANYLKSYAQHMYDKGAPIYVISIQNEPNFVAEWDGCEWEPEEMRDFLKQVGRFTNGVSGYGGGKTIPSVLIMNGESWNTPYINIATLEDPVSKAVIDVLGRHAYGERTESLWNDHHDLLQKEGKMMEVWMTEHNINSTNAVDYYNDSTWNYVWRFMNDIDLTIRQNNENAFVWWAAKRFYSMIGDGQYVTMDGAVLPRGCGLSHYAKYSIDTTRIGFTITGTTADGTAIGEIDVDNAPVINGTYGDFDNTTVRITAFVSEDGNEISLVMWTPTLTNGTGGYDMGTIKIDMPDGFTIGSATGIRSYQPTEPWRGVYPEPYAPLIANDRRSAYVTLPRSQIISVKFTR